MGSSNLYFGATAAVYSRECSLYGTFWWESRKQILYYSTCCNNHNTKNVIDEYMHLMFLRHRISILVFLSKLSPVPIRASVKVKKYILSVFTVERWKALSQELWKCRSCGIRDFEAANAIFVCRRGEEDVFKHLSSTIVITVSLCGTKYEKWYILWC